MSNEQRTLEQDIESVINRHSAENESNTPDFILAQYLMACLAAWNAASINRDKWHGVALSPGSIGGR